MSRETVPSWLLRLLPSSERARYHEEWSADLLAADDLGIHPQLLLAGFRRTALLLRKNTVMTAIRTSFTPIRITAQATLVIPVSAIALIVALAGAPLLAAGLFLIGIAALYASHRLALAVAARLGSERMPWLIYFGAALSAMSLAAGLIEVNMLFAANDFGGAAPAYLTVVMVATGIIGTGAALATIGLLIGTTVAVLRRRLAPISA